VTIIHLRKILQTFSFIKAFPLRKSVTATKTYHEPQNIPNAKMKFFGPDIWQGKEISFLDDPEVIWVLDQKLSENSIQDTKEESTAPNLPSVAWAVFSCSRKDGLEGKHAMKIYMQ
jgi:hypothetical protein